MKKQLYSPHPSLDYARSIVAKLPASTGRSLEEWLGLIKKEGPKDEKERRAWLKEKHGLGSTKASMMAEISVGKTEGINDDAYLAAAEDYVQAQYTGKKAHLKPIYDALLKLGVSLGKDVKVCPCKTIVPLYRHHVFAEIKPATQKRIDFGLALGDVPAKGRLIDTGGLKKKDRITHKLEITSVDEVDREVTKWLKQAYERDK